MICVIAKIETTPGQRDEFLAEFHNLVPKVLAEEGCIEYGPMVDLPTNIDAQGPLRENAVTVVEKWESIEALEAHLIAPHMNEFRKAIKPKVSSISLQIIEPAE